MKITCRNLEIHFYVTHGSRKSEWKLENIFKVCLI